MGPLGPSLDGVVAHKAGVGATGFRNVPATLEVFETHFPRFPVLPGVLIVDGMVVLARTYLAKEVGGDWRLSEAQRIRWRHYVRPGDRMDLEVRALEVAVESADLSATATVAGRGVAAARLRLVRSG